MDFGLASSKELGRIYNGSKQDIARFAPLQRRDVPRGEKGYKDGRSSRFMGILLLQDIRSQSFFLHSYFPSLCIIILKMKYSFALAAFAAAACVLADEDTCTFDAVEAVEAPVVNTTTMPLTPANTTNLFAPAPAPGIDTHDVAYVVPQGNVSLYYGSNITTSASVNINHTMKYPTIVLEQIASIISVDCSNTSVAMTFNNSAVFATTQAAWIADGTMVFITNHLGDCDPVLERSFFLSSSLSFDNTTLVATASSVKANVSSTAGKSVLTGTESHADSD